MLDIADDDYRELFLDRVNAFLDGADASIYDGLAAIDRLKWHLVRRRLMPELLEVLRFQKEDARRHAAGAGARELVRGLSRFAATRGLKIPASVYRLGTPTCPASPISRSCAARATC